MVYGKDHEVGRRDALKQLGGSAVGGTIGALGLINIGSSPVQASDETSRKIADHYKETGTAGALQFIETDPITQKSHDAVHVLEVTKFEPNGEEVENYLFSINSCVYSQAEYEGPAVQNYTGLVPGVLEHSVGVDINHVSGPSTGIMHDWWSDECAIYYEENEGTGLSEILRSGLVEDAKVALDVAVMAASAAARTTVQGLVISGGYELFNSMRKADPTGPTEDWAPPTSMTESRVYDLSEPVVPELASTHFIGIEKPAETTLDLIFQGKSFHQTPNITDSEDDRLQPSATIELTI